MLFLKKPGFGQKLWIRIVLALLVLSILALAATFWYWYLAVRGEPEITTPVNPTPEQKALLAACVKALRRAGTGRTRGKGKIAVSLTNRDLMPAKFAKTTSEDLGSKWFDQFKEMAK